MEALNEFKAKTGHDCPQHPRANQHVSKADQQRQDWACLRAPGEARDDSLMRNHPPKPGRMPLRQLVQVRQSSEWDVVATDERGDIVAEAGAANAVEA